MGALIALAVLVPLGAHLLLERRARRVARTLTLTPPPMRSRLGVPIAIAGVAALLALAAAQPVISGTKTQLGRADAEVYLLFDTSRSMLARRNSRSPTRLERAKQLAQDLRLSIRDVPVGIASLTDRVLPHLFPTLDAQVFSSTLRDSIAIERPPPAGSGDLATDFNSLANIAANNYFRPKISKRLLVVFSDGESRAFDDLVLSRALRTGHVRVLFVHLWNAHEQVFLLRNAADPGYRPDPESIRAAERVAIDGQGELLNEDEGSLRAATKDFIGTGPATQLREQRTRVSLAPYIALAALLPLSFVFLRRNL
jgi:VWA domain-containing protein